MPQMAPIWWSTLFVILIITYMIIMVLMYFYNIYKMEIKILKKNLMNKNIFWKW